MIRLGQAAVIPAHYMNRHVLVTGPTGTGKTVSIINLIENLSKLNVPVIAPDVKGDLSSLSGSCDTNFLIPGKTLFVPIWAMGADLISRALELTQAQAGAVEISFAYADEIGAPLNTLSDLRTLLTNISATPSMVLHLGYVTRASIGAVQRALLRIDRQGQGAIFGPHTFDIEKHMTSGLVSVIDASGLYQSPRIYGALMLYLLQEISTRFPEVGDLDRPRLVLVIDEAHCLFHEATPALLRSMEAMARLIRSKGVALIFASQSPQDLPKVIRDQCSTRIEHERELGVGNARFTTLDGRGKATVTSVIRPSLPACFSASAKVPEPSPRTDTSLLAQRHTEPVKLHQPSLHVENMDAHGYVFLAVAAVVLIAFGYWLGTE